jgi:Zn-dependent protease
MIGGIVFWWIAANLGLGFFNMIPFGPLDGAKIKDWNEGVWFASFATFIAIIILWWSGTFSPIDLATIIAEQF